VVTIMSFSLRLAPRGEGWSGRNYIPVLLFFRGCLDDIKEEVRSYSMCLYNEYSEIC